MIYCVNYRTWDRFGNALSSQFHLRYRLLVDEQYWSLSRFQGMEYDQYDTPAATYLVWQDEDGIVRGCVRVIPTDRPYMLRDIWPDMVETCPLPESMSVWEATRFCVDKTLPRDLRQRIKHELVCSFLEFGLQNDIRQMIGVMPPKLWNSVFVQSGWDVEFVGKPKKLDDGDTIIAALMPISPRILQNVRRITGMENAVLRMDIDNTALSENRVRQKAHSVA